MTEDKVKQYVAMLGGFLGALYLAFQASGLSFEWFNDETINAWMNALNAAVPLVFVLYGVYKNQYILTKKAKAQEAVLKENELK